MRRACLYIRDASQLRCAHSCVHTSAFQLVELDMKVDSAKEQQFLQELHKARHPVSAHKQSITPVLGLRTLGCSQARS